MSRIQALFAAQIAVNKRPNHRMRPVGGMAPASVFTASARDFEIGRHVVAHEQQGERRAQYGKEVQKTSGSV